MSPWVRRTVLAVVLAAIGWLAFRALRPTPVAVDAARVGRGPFEESVEEDGRTRVRDRYLVSAPLAGRLERIALRAGDPIDADSVVAVIQPIAPPLLDARATRELGERVGAAEAALEQAGAELARVRTARDQRRVDFERAQKLAADGIIASSDLDQVRLALDLAERELTAAEAGVHTAEHDLASARAALGRMRDGGDEPFRVTAPHGGRVFRVLQESAGVVGQGTPLLEIADPADLEIVVDVLTSDAVRIVPGAPVVIERWGGETPLDGRVRLVEPSGFTKLSALGVEEQRTNVIIDLTSPPATWQSLGDGFRVDARIVVFRAEDALTMPAGALFRDGDGWSAFVVEGGRARKRTVASPRRNARQALVEDGLADGDVVVLYPTDAIADGVAVTTR
jgi:HlyD family secretion protein